MRIAVTGSRNRRLTSLEIELIQLLVDPDNILLHGGCRGVDRDAERAVAPCGAVVIEYPADWDHNGLAAGPIRNAEMVKGADILLAFPGGASAGTWDCVRKAREAGVPVWICEEAP